MTTARKGNQITAFGLRLNGRFVNNDRAGDANGCIRDNFGAGLRDSEWQSLETIPDRITRPRISRIRGAVVLAILAAAWSELRVGILRRQRGRT